MHPEKADARVVAVTLDRFEAEALGVKAGSPAIVLTRTVYDADGVWWNWRVTSTAATARSSR